MPYVEVLQKYAVFDGRAKRSEYWLFTLVQLIIFTVLAALSSVVGEWFPWRVLPVFSRGHCCPRWL